MSGVCHDILGKLQQIPKTEVLLTIAILELYAASPHAIRLTKGFLASTTRCRCQPCMQHSLKGIKRGLLGNPPEM